MTRLLVSCGQKNPIISGFCRPNPCGERPEIRSSGPTAEDAWRGDYHDFTGIDPRSILDQVHSVEASPSGHATRRKTGARHGSSHRRHACLDLTEHVAGNRGIPPQSANKKAAV
jgi:hypothetical protein